MTNQFFDLHLSCLLWLIFMVDLLFVYFIFIFIFFFSERGLNQIKNNNKMFRNANSTELSECVQLLEVILKCRSEPPSPTSSTVSRSSRASSTESTYSTRSTASGRSLAETIALAKEKKLRIQREIEEQQAADSIPRSILKASSQGSGSRVRFCRTLDITFLK